MASLFDPEIYPCVSSYVASLPDGLDSYPECTCRADVPKSVREEYPEVFDGRGLSSEARHKILAPWGNDDWIPDATNIALRLMGRDRRCQSDAQYLSWTQQYAGRVFERPLYRALMYLMSPTLILMGIEKRWQTFRRGTRIECSGRRKDGSAEVVIYYPPRLYPRLMSQAVARAFRAALEAAKAKELIVELTEHTETESRYHVAWR